MALTDNILAYWNLNDDGSGGVSLVDTSGNGNTLTNNGGVSLGAGIIDGGASLNNSNLYTTNSFNLSGDFSISLWVNLQNSNDQAFFEAVDNFKFGLGYFGNNLGWAIPNSTLLISAGALPVSSWSYITITRESGVTTLYINGSISSSISGDSNDYSNAISIGNSATGYDPASTAILDEIGIWSRVLSSSEVASLYNGGDGYNPFNILYYNADVNNDWGTLGNWWNDAAFTSPATSLPDSTIRVFIYADVLENTAGDGVCYCALAEFYSASFYSPLVLNSTGVINFNGTGGVFDGTATDGISFHDTCSLGENGFVTGNAMFRDSSTNSFGTVNGNAVFHEASYNYGQINGDAEVWYDGGDGTYPIGGVVDGSVSYLGWPAVQDQYFNDDVAGAGAAGNWEDKNNWWADDSFTTRPINSVGTQELPDVGTNIYLYAAIYAYNTSSSINVNRARFYGSAYLNTPITLNVSVNVYFYNSSGNQSNIYGDCYFYENSYFYGNFGAGLINGNCYFYNNSGIYQEYYDSYTLTTGGVYFYSLESLENSFTYKFTSGVNGITYNIQSEGSSMISRLLNLPWFINI